MARFFWKDGAWRDRDGNPMEIPERDGVCAPRVQSDIPDYRSPIDGKLIGSRSHRRYDLEKNDCVEVDPRPKEKRGYRNPHFAKKRGLPLREDVRVVKERTPAT